MSLDTLKVYSYDYNLRKESKDFLMFQSTYRIGEGKNKILNIDGLDVCSDRAFIKDDLFNAQFNSRFQKDGKSIAIVNFSVPIAHHGDNFYGTGLGGFQSSINMVQEKLDKQYGIEIDLMGSKCSRVDFFNNYSLSYPVQNYYPILQILNGSRMKSRDYGTSYLWGNKQQEYCCYDKKIEMFDKGKVIPSGVKALNIMRAEHRLFSNKNIEKRYHVETVGDLVHGYYEAKRIDLLSWKKNIFNKNIKEFEDVLITNLLEKMVIYKKVYRFWLNEFLYGYGVAQIDKVLGLDRFVEMLKSNDLITRDGLNKQRKKMVNSLLNFKENKNITYKVLYEEILSKIDEEIARAS